MPNAKEWAIVLKQLKNIPTPIPHLIVGGDTPGIVGGDQEHRVAVFTTIWQDMKKALKKV